MASFCFIIINETQIHKTVNPKKQQENVETPGACRWHALPVPAETVVYTAEERESMAISRFGQTVSREAVWVYQRVEVDNPRPHADAVKHTSPTPSQDRWPPGGVVTERYRGTTVRQGCCPFA